MSTNKIYTNHRGYVAYGDRRTLDGCFDGWPWHAWSGAHIAYGATEDQAISQLREKLVAAEGNNAIDQRMDDECEADLQPFSEKDPDRA